MSTRRLFVSSVLLLSSCPLIASASLYTSVDGYAWAGPDGGGGSTWNGGEDRFSGGPSQTSSQAGEYTRTDLLISPEDPSFKQPVTWDAKASEVSNVSAEYGHLHAYAAISSLTTPYTVSLQGYAPSGAPFSDTFSTPAGAGGGSTMAATCSDLVTITSSSLPNGAPVSVRFTIHIDGSTSVSAPAVTPNMTFTPSANASLGLSPGSNGAYFPGGSVNLTNPTFTETVTFHVGDTINPYLGLNASASVEEAVSWNYKTYINPGGSATVDVAHTGSLYIDPVTDGVSLSSASGHDYTMPVPEPTSASLLTLSSLALLARRRKPSRA